MAKMKPIDMEALRAEGERQRAAKIAVYANTPWAGSRTIDFVLDDGRPVSVKYTAPGGGFMDVHLEFHGPAVSPTGYRSEFPREPDGGFIGTPEAYCKALAERLAVECAAEEKQRARRERAKAKKALPTAA